METTDGALPNLAGSRFCPFGLETVKPAPKESDTNTLGVGARAAVPRGEEFGQMNRTLLGATLAAGSVLALVAGCGGNSVKTSSASASTTAASAGASASASSVSAAPAAILQAALTSSSSDKSVTFTGSFTSSSGTGRISGQEEFSPQYAVQMNLVSSQATVSEIWIGSTIYMKDPALTGALGGKTWVSFNLSSMGAAGSAMSSETSTLKNTNPASLIESMLVADNLADLGSQTVDGVQTTHYSGTINPATAYDGAAAKKYLTPAEIQQLQSAGSTAGASSEKIDIWLASDGLPVQIVIVDSTSAGSTTSTMQFSGWGQSVSISAPPASEVGSLPTG